MKVSAVYATELIHQLKSGKTSVSEIAEYYTERIQKFDSELGAFLYFNPEDVMRQASVLDKKRASGAPLGKLFGLPIAIKDNICTKGMPTTAGSKILEKYQPPYNATAVEHLLNEDALIIGKTNLDEFAMGSSCEHSAFKLCRNAYNREYVPGGSSGGSATAVAARLCIAALGSDTGGSVRQPASFSNIVGFKPTYGLVSRYGLIAFASSLDIIGPMTISALDAALLCSVICKYDRCDSTSLNLSIDFSTVSLNNRLNDMRIGLLEESLKHCENDVADRISDTVRTFEKLGARIVPVEMPILLESVPIYYVVATAEASANLARYSGVIYGKRSKSHAKLASEMMENTRSLFGEEVKRRILLGTFVLSSGYYDSYYIKALKCRTLLINSFSELFKTVDFLLTPTSPTTPFKIGERLDDPIKMYESDLLTVSANLAGLPAVSFPCGFSKNGLPIGAQIMGPHLSDAKLLSLVATFQNETDFHLIPPALS